MQLAATNTWLKSRGIGSVTPNCVEQDAYIRDTSPQLAALCSRRAGKSYGNAGRLLRAASRAPGELSLYIALTKNNARMIVGRALQEMSIKHGLGLQLKEVDGRLMCLHPNGSMTWLAGAPHRAAFEDFRGYKFSECIIDEAQVYGSYLQEVCEEIIEPALGDLEGPLVLSGTPSAAPVGYFHAVTTGDDVDAEGTPIPKWPTHHWTVAENNFFRLRNGLPHGDEWREEIRKRRGWSTDHPTYVREYLGQWADDPGALMFPWEPGRNSYQDPPPDGEYSYVVACDLGATDRRPSTAFVVLAARRGHPEVYVVETRKVGGLIPSEVAARLAGLRDQYRPRSIVIDAGGLGAAYVKECNDIWSLNAEAADKRERLANVELVRGDLLSGNIKVRFPRERTNLGEKPEPHPNAELLAELTTAQWNEDHTDADSRYWTDAADALVYGWRRIRQIYRPEVDGPKFGTAEWQNEEARRLKEAAMRDVERSRRSRGKKAWWGK